MNKMRKSKGFTLIELMIVVAIIGILAAVAVPKFADLVTKSKEASVKGSLGAVRSAVSIYYGDMEGVYPTNLFVGLATGNRYMPAVGGTPSLGAMAIPTNNLGNSGHTPAAGVGTGVLSGDVLQATSLSAESLIWYNSVDGALYVGCSHNDTKAVKWTAY